MRILVLFLAALSALIFVNCGKSERQKYITTSHKVIDSIYNKNQQILVGFCEEIEAIDDIKKTLDKKIILKDSIADPENELMVLAMQFMQDSTYLDAGYRFSSANSCFVSRYDALNIYGIAEDSLLKNKKHKFELAFANNDADLLMLFHPDIWNRHQQKDFEKYHNDSLTASGKLQEIYKYNEKLRQIKKAQYIVYIEDVYHLRPHMLIKEKKFESGMLISKIKVFDRKTKSKIGETTLLSANNDEIATLPAVFPDDKMNIRVYIKQIENDLLNNKMSKILQFLKREKDDK